MGGPFHTPWRVDCGSIAMGGEIVASRVAPEAATRDEVARIHALLVASPKLAAALIGLLRETKHMPAAPSLLDARDEALRALHLAKIDASQGAINDLTEGGV